MRATQYKVTSEINVDDIATCLIRISHVFSRLLNDELFFVRFQLE